MSARKASTSRALFLELVLDLVIFAICAVICLQVFAGAHLESARSAALSQLGAEAQQIAEMFKSGADDTALITALPTAKQEKDTISWYYDQNLSPVPVDQAYFTLTCVIDETRSLRQAKIVLTEGSRQLFEYDVSSYRPDGGGGS
jgi:Tfp pilus assembly protein PilE